MQNLFSHAHEPDYESPRETENYEQAVLIDVPVDQAFDGFTDGIHLWWPVDEQSVFGEGSHVAVLRDHLVEESENGEEVLWADIQEWKSPEFIRLHWTLGQEELGSSDVDIHFEAAKAGMTRIRISSEQASSPERGPDSAFVCDWSLILARYVRFMGGAVPLD